MIQIKNIISSIVALMFGIFTLFISVYFAFAIYDILLAPGNSVIIMSMCLFMIMNNEIFGVLCFIAGIKIFKDKRNDEIILSPEWDEAFSSVEPYNKLDPIDEDDSDTKEDCI